MLLRSPGRNRAPMGKTTASYDVSNTLPGPPEHFIIMVEYAETKPAVFALSKVQLSGDEAGNSGTTVA